MKDLIGTLLHSVERTILVSIIFLLFATNILSITSNPVHEKLYKLLSYVPYQSLLNDSPAKKLLKIADENQMLLKQNQELIAKSAAHRSALIRARSITQGIARRTVKNVVKNVTSVAGEAVPYLGAALVVTVTAADVSDGCENIRDVNAIVRTLEVDSIDDYESEVCGMKVPSVNEILSSIKQNLAVTADQAKKSSSDSARQLYDTFGGTLYEIFK